MCALLCLQPLGLHGPSHQHHLGQSHWGLAPTSTSGALSKIKEEREEGTSGSWTGHEIALVAVLITESLIITVLVSAEGKRKM